METSKRKGVVKMDDKIAKAFAGKRFEQLHPRSTWPEWMRRCMVSYWSRDKQGKFLVGMTLTPKSTGDAFSFFQTTVDPDTGDTTVLIDLDLATLNGSDYVGF
jgi:hypothetical protein